MDILACFQGVANVNNYMESNPRVRQLAQVVKSIAIGILTGALFGFASYYTMGFSLAASLILGLSLGGCAGVSYWAVAEFSRLGIAAPLGYDNVDNNPLLAPNVQGFEQLNQTSSLPPGYNGG